VKAVVLVGGEGTRLRPLTYRTPKPLLPIVDQPFLERQLSWLAAGGIDEVVLSLGYLPDAFEAHFRAGRFGDVRLRYAVEEHPLGTAGAIRFAAEGLDERIVVCNGDVLTTLDLAALVAFHDARGAEATIHLTEVADPSAFGVVPTRDDGAVVAFVEKPPMGQAPSNWINAGTYVLEPSVLARIPEGRAVSIERETFPRLLEDGGRLYAMTSSAYWIDIGTPEKYLQAHADVLGGALGTPVRPGAREQTTGIWLEGAEEGAAREGEGAVQVAADACLEPPLLLGDGANVGVGARVAGSVLGPRSRVGAGARVVGSVLHAGASVGDHAEVSDSVLGRDAVVGAGAVVSHHTIIGPAAVLAPGARAVGARIREAETDAGDTRRVEV
jgi:NDP-sugar pyrophosphorylase family protein